MAPDIWRLPIPLPRHSVGHVNVYALLADDGVLLIDSGWGIPESQDALNSMLCRIGGSPSDVRRLLLTHFHPDHCGSAGAFQRAGLAEVHMHGADACHLGDRFFNRVPLESETVAWLTAAGATAGVVAAGIRNVVSSAAKVTPLSPDHLVQDGEVITHGRWEIVALHTPGHTPGHLCFYERTTRTLFSGDHVLSFINTSPGFRPHSTADPVGDYLTSFERLSKLEVDRVLPGHQDPFAALPERLEGLRAHHRERLDETLGLVDEGHRTVWDVTRHIGRSRSWEDFTDAGKISAIGETYGHLVHLAALGHLHRIRGCGAVQDYWHM